MNHHSLAESAADLATRSMSAGTPPEPAALAKARADLHAALTEAPDDLQVLFFAFQFHIRLGEPEPAETHARRRLALCAPNSPDESRACTNLGLARFLLKDLAEAERFFTRAIEVSRALNRPEDLARDLGNSACIAESRGDLDRAEAIYLEVLAIARPLHTPKGDEIAAGAVSNLGDVAQARGNRELALTLWRRAKAEFDRLGVDKWNARFAELLG